MNFALLDWDLPTLVRCSCGWASRMIQKKAVLSVVLFRPFSRVRVTQPLQRWQKSLGRFRDLFAIVMPCSALSETTVARHTMRPIRSTRISMFFPLALIRRCAHPPFSMLQKNAGTALWQRAKNMVIEMPRRLSLLLPGPLGSSWIAIRQELNQTLLWSNSRSLLEVVT